jgi:hypothetical protein
MNRNTPKKEVNLDKLDELITKFKNKKINSTLQDSLKKRMEIAMERKKNILKSTSQKKPPVNEETKIAQEIGNMFSQPTKKLVIPNKKLNLQNQSGGKTNKKNRVNLDSRLVNDKLHSLGQQTNQNSFPNNEFQNRKEKLLTQLTNDSQKRHDYLTILNSMNNNNTNNKTGKTQIKPKTKTGGGKKKTDTNKGKTRSKISFNPNVQYHNLETPLNTISLNRNNNQYDNQQNTVSSNITPQFNFKVPINILLSSNLTNQPLNPDLVSNNKYIRKELENLYFKKLKKQQDDARLAKERENYLLKKKLFEQQEKAKKLEQQQYLLFKSQLNNQSSNRNNYHPLGNNINKKNPPQQISYNNNFNSNSNSTKEYKQITINKIDHDSNSNNAPSYTPPYPRQNNLNNNNNNNREIRSTGGGILGSNVIKKDSKKEKKSNLIKPFVLDNIIPTAKPNRSPIKRFIEPTTSDSIKSFTIKTDQSLVGKENEGNPEISKRELKNNLAEKLKNIGELRKQQQSQQSQNSIKSNEFVNIGKLDSITNDNNVINKEDKQKIISQINIQSQKNSGKQKIQINELLAKINNLNDITLIKKTIQSFMNQQLTIPKIESKTRNKRKSLDKKRNPIKEFNHKMGIKPNKVRGESLFEKKMVLEVDNIKTLSSYRHQGGKTMKKNHFNLKLRPKLTNKQLAVIETTQTLDNILDYLENKQIINVRDRFKNIPNDVVETLYRLCADDDIILTYE